MNPSTPSPPDTSRPDEAFVRHLTDSQSRLYAFIVSLLGHADPAQDLLQETNVALWRKADTFDATRPFLPWAMGFARLQVLAWRRGQAGSRLVYDDDLFELMATDMEQPPATPAWELEALEVCLARLRPEQRQLLDRCYGRDEAVQDVAQDLGRSISGLSVTLHRLRRALLDCVRARVALEHQP